MMGMLAAVKSRVPQSCRAESIRGQGCSVSLDGTPPKRLIIDLDKPGSPLSQNQTRCDYLLLAELADKPGLIYPIELKAGRAGPGDVKDQLQAGANVAAHLTPTDCEVKLLPILASGSDKAGRKRIRATVVFRESEIPIRRIRCGQPLPSA